MAIGLSIRSADATAEQYEAVNAEMGVEADPPEGLIFHAGEDRSGGGGIQGYQAIWAHRGNVGSGGYVADDRGTANLADDIKLDGYTMQYENVGTGVLVHEFGHDLGLPDLYSSDGDNGVNFWSLMSSASYLGQGPNTTGRFPGDLSLSG